MNDTKEATAKQDTSKLAALREGYQNSLNQTNQQIAQLSNTLQMLNQKVEQLKGAIFGLQELEGQMNPQAAKPADAPAAEVKAAKVSKAAKTSKSDEKAAASGQAQ